MYFRTFPTRPRADDVLNGTKVMNMVSAIALLRREPTGVYVQVVSSGTYHRRVTCFAEHELRAVLKDVRWSKNHFAIMRPIEIKPVVPRLVASGQVIPLRRPRR